MVIVEDALTIERHVSLVEEDQTFLAEGTSHQDGTRLCLLGR